MLELTARTNSVFGTQLAGVKVDRGHKPTAGRLCVGIGVFETSR